MSRRNADRWKAIQAMTFIHQAVTAMRTADIERNNVVISRTFRANIILRTHSVEYISNLEYFHIRKVSAIDNDDRAVSAGSATFDRVERKLVVGGGVTGRYGQLPRDLSGYRQGTPGVAVGAKATINKMFTARLQAKMVVICHHAVDIGQGAAGFLRHRFDVFFGKIAISGLNRFQHGNQPTRIVFFAFNQADICISLHFLPTPAFSAYTTRV
jgi:hypothetical protein